MKDSDIVLNIVGLYEKMEEAYKDSFDRSERNTNYVLNQQWDKSQIAKLNRLSKAYLTYNILIPSLNTLTGNEQLSSRKIVFKSSNPKDDAMVDIMNQRYEMLCNDQDMKRLEMEAYVNAFIYNHGGHIEYEIKTDKYGDTELYFGSGDPFNIMYEPNSQKYDLSDCRYLIKYKWASLEEIEELYGKIEGAHEEDKNSIWRQITDFVSGTTMSKNAKYYDKQNNKYLIMEFQKKEYVDTSVCIYNGSYISLTKEELNILKEKGEQFNVIRTSTATRIRKQIIVPYFKDVVLYDAIVPYLTSFNIIPFHSFGWRANIQERISLIELLIDAQDDINKAKSQHADMRKNLSAKLTQIQSRDESVYNQYVSQQGEPEIVLKVNKIDESIKVQPLQSAIDPNIFATVDSSKQLAQEISQITPAMQGRSEKSGESNAIYQNKVAVGSASINQYYDNIARSRRMIAKVFVELFPIVYGDEDRIISLMDEYGNVDKTILNFKQNGEIFNNVNDIDDVIIAESSSTLTNREETFNKMFMILQQLGAANPLISAHLVPELFKLIDLPNKEELVNKLNSMLAQQDSSNQEAQTLDYADRIINQQKALREPQPTNETQ